LKQTKLNNTHKKPVLGCSHSLEPETIEAFCEKTLPEEQVWILLFQIENCSSCREKAEQFARDAGHSEVFKKLLRNLE